MGNKVQKNSGSQSPRAVSPTLVAITQQHNNHCLSHLFSGRKRGIRFAWETPPNSHTTVIFWGLNRWISHMLLLEETPLSRNMCGYPILTDRQQSFDTGKKFAPWVGNYTAKRRYFITFDSGMVSPCSGHSFFQYSPRLFAVISDAAITNKSNRSGINHAARKTDYCHIGLEVLLSHLVRVLKYYMLEAFKPEVTFPSDT